MDEPSLPQKKSTNDAWRKRHPFAMAFHNIVQRCYNPNHPSYHNYGGRGIKLSAEWLDNCAAFERWAAAQYKESGWSLDRIDNDGDYSPSNCRYTSYAEQQRNRQDSRRVTAFGETKTLKEWSRDPRCAISWAGLHGRLAYGMSPEEALTCPRVDKGRLAAINPELAAIRRDKWTRRTKPAEG